ncbi:MAG: oxidoreductase [Spirochaetae bacterium HGW-Spirochaetae-8]|jgi:short-subunit dehydrogenase|nr:MAG: oxidoreductase [Spirochaetae bacterium HGW-Spirochaetae-8]
MNFTYGKNVLVTGASSGIGLAISLLFAQKGFQVWGVSRSGKTNRELPPAIRLRSMDVTIEDSVANGIQAIWDEMMQETGEGFGTIIHCAGWGIGGAAEDTPQAEAERQFQTNYFGVLRVNRHALPLMRSRGPSMVLVVGSIAGRISIPFQSHYSASKFALEAYVEALRMEGRSFGIHATVLEPGDTATAFTQQRVMVLPPDSPYAKKALLAVKKMEHDEINGASPEKVAKLALRIAVRRNPPIRSVVGIGYRLLLVAKKFLPARLVEIVIRSMYIVDK